MKITDYNNKHKGETIYLIGNGPDLLNIPDDYKKKIQKGISIGVNACHLFLPETTYFVGGHWSSYLLNCHYGKVTGCRFFQGLQRLLSKTPILPASYQLQGPYSLEYPFYEQNNTIDIAPNMRYPFDDVSVLFENVTETSPILGQEQIGFTATHLACIMGAKNIVYLGFDQRTSNHYYQDEKLIGLFMEQSYELLKRYEHDPFLNNDIRTMIRKITKKEVLDYASAKNVYGLKFGSMFAKMKKKGVRPVVHNKDSIIAESGGIVMPYDGELSSD